MCGWYLTAYTNKIKFIDEELFSHTPIGRDGRAKKDGGIQKRDNKIEIIKRI